MAKVITTELQHSGASGANITLDSSKNVTCTGNAYFESEIGLINGSTNAARFIDAGLGDNNALFLRGTSAGDANHETLATFTRNGSVALYHDNTEQCSTSANGLAFPAGKGIDFSASAHAAGMENELLDDYERGNWTPQFAGGSTNFTQSVSQGYYTKIGNLVYAFWNVAWSSKNSATSTMKLTGFPFTSKSNDGQYYYLGQNTGAWTVDSYDDVAWQVMLVGNGTTADYLGYQPGSGNTLQASELPASSRHYGSIVYPT